MPALPLHRATVVNWANHATHRSRGKSRKVKKMQDETEGAMKISARRASKRAPTWYSCTITPKSLSGQPLDHLIQTRSRGWPERDFGVIVQLYHVGARFEALRALIFIAPSVSSCIFFYVPRFPSGTIFKGMDLPLIWVIAKLSWVNPKIGSELEVNLWKKTLCKHAYTPWWLPESLYSASGGF